MEYNYVLTISYDGELAGTYRMTDFMEAHRAWSNCNDHGNAKEYANYNLTDPTGKMYTKNFYANGEVTVR